MHSTLGGHTKSRLEEPLQRYRIHEAAERMAAGEAQDLTRLALELGYFDLAHFTRHFRRAVGRSPTAFLRAGAAA
jgi:AraC-like DNA-binding protein